jgi:DNA-binding transcriptional LysR family regulator
MADDVWAACVAVFTQRLGGTPTLEVVSAIEGFDAAFAAYDDDLNLADDVVGRAGAAKVATQVVDDPLPDWVAALTPTIAKKWRIKADLRVRDAFDARVAEEAEVASRAGRTVRTRADIRRDAIVAALRVAWGERDKPWVPRRDSRRVPHIPSELDHDQLAAWLVNETINAAECELLDIPYPPPTDGYGRQVRATGTDGQQWTRDTWESGEAGVDITITQDGDPEDDFGEATPTWDLFDDGEWGPTPEEREASARKVLAALRDKASPKVREYLECFIQVAKTGQPSWAEVARRMDVTEGAVRTQIKRLRDRVDGPPLS